MQKIEIYGEVLGNQNRNNKLVQLDVNHSKTNVNK